MKKRIFDEEKNIFREIFISQNSFNWFYFIIKQTNYSALGFNNNIFRQIPFIKWIY